MTLKKNHKETGKASDNEVGLRPVKGKRKEGSLGRSSDHSTVLTRPGGTLKPRSIPRVLHWTAMGQAGTSPMPLPVTSWEQSGGLELSL